jgi:hypothetical protein
LPHALETRTGDLKPVQGGNRFDFVFEKNFHFAAEIGSIISATRFSFAT